MQGWIKGINSTTLDALRDIGQDGLSIFVNAQFAPDTFTYDANGPMATSLPSAEMPKTERP